jgi:hypothetical protein
LADPRKDTEQDDKLSAAPLPQKNAVAPPATEASKRGERRLDKALEETFPASDPVAEVPPVVGESGSAPEKVQVHEEDLLDEALEETFPASDPIAAHGADKVGRSSARH